MKIPRRLFTANRTDMANFLNAELVANAAISPALSSNDMHGAVQRGVLILCLMSVLSGIETRTWMYKAGPKKLSPEDFKLWLAEKINSTIKIKPVDNNSYSNQVHWMIHLLGKVEVTNE